LRIESTGQASAYHSSEQALLPLKAGIRRPGVPTGGFNVTTVAHFEHQVASARRPEAVAAAAANLETAIAAAAATEVRKADLDAAFRANVAVEDLVRQTLRCDEFVLEWEDPLYGIPFNQDGLVAGVSVWP
jgi:hypothetical protein